MEEFLRFKPTFISTEKVIKYIRIVYSVGDVILYLNEHGDVDQMKIREKPLIETKLRKIVKNKPDYPNMLLFIKSENVCKFIELITKHTKRVLIKGCVYPDNSSEMYEFKFKNTLMPGY